MSPWTAGGMRAYMQPAAPYCAAALGWVAQFHTIDVRASTGIPSDCGHERSSGAEAERRQHYGVRRAPGGRGRQRARAIRTKRHLPGAATPAAGSGIRNHSVRDRGGVLGSALLVPCNGCCSRAGPARSPGLRSIRVCARSRISSAMPAHGSWVGIGHELTSAASTDGVAAVVACCSASARDSVPWLRFGFCRTCWS